MDDNWAYFIGIFDTRIVYIFTLMNGTTKTGQVVKGTKLKTDGIPIVVGLAPHAGEKPTVLIPWTSVESYKEVS